MPASQSYFLDIIMIGLGIFYLIYIFYGRARKQSILGDYKPGHPGYAAFVKMTNSNKLLVIIVAGTLFFSVNAFFDAKSVLNSSVPHSILVVAPLLVVIGIPLLTIVIQRVLGTRNK